MYSLRSLTLSEWTIEASASEEEDEEGVEDEVAAFPVAPAAASAAAPPPRESSFGGYRTSTPLLPLFFPTACPSTTLAGGVEATNTVRGDTGPLGGVDGGEEEEELEGEDDGGDESSNGGRAGVVGADWIPTGRGAAAAAPAAAPAPAPAPAPARAETAAAFSPFLRARTIPAAIARTRLGVVVEDAETEGAADSAAAPPLLVFVFFWSLHFFMPPAPLRAPSGPKNLAYSTSM